MNAEDHTCKHCGTDLMILMVLDKKGDPQAVVLCSNCDQIEVDEAHVIRPSD